MTLSLEEINKQSDLFPSKSFKEISEQFSDFLKMAKEVGYAKVVNESPKFRGVVKIVYQALKEQNADDVADIVLELSKMSFDIFDDLITNNKFALDEVAHLPDMIVSFQCPELDFFHYIKIKNGKYHHIMGKVREIEKKEPDLEVIMTKAAMINSTQGTTTYPKELVKGRISMVGDLKMGLKLQQVFEVIRGGLDFELKLM